MCYGDQYDLVSYSNNHLFRVAGAPRYFVRQGETFYFEADVPTWDATAQNTLQAFIGGVLPTLFSGDYGVDMVPNTDYFSMTSGDAIDSGITLLAPFTGCINGAGLAVPITRPQGLGFDIGAYEDDTP